MASRGQLGVSQGLLALGRKIPVHLSYFNQKNHFLQSDWSIFSQSDISISHSFYYYINGRASRGQLGVSQGLLALGRKIPVH